MYYSCWLLLELNGKEYCDNLVHETLVSLQHSKYLFKMDTIE